MDGIMKKMAFIQKVQDSYWVGDGFPSRSIFSYEDIAKELSPFVLLDYIGPTSFPPAQKRLGIGEHPHRGVDAVTILYAGEVEHRDSSGAGGKVGPGDVQWMTAASGVVHEELHGTEYAKRGGPFEMLQLWVDLPRKHKMTAPGYQALASDQIPSVVLPGGAGSVRVIAGDFRGVRGPARTFSPLNVWDARLAAGGNAVFEVPRGYSTAFFVLNGLVRVRGSEPVGPAELGVLDREGDRFELEILENSTVLFLNGLPLGEPIVGHGAFVMNTEDEIRQAISDYESGKMGRLPSRV